MKPKLSRSYLIPFLLIGGLLAATQLEAQHDKIAWLEGEWSYEMQVPKWGPNYGASRGITQAKKTGKVVAIGPINAGNNKHMGDLCAIVGESGNISWEFDYYPDSGCMGERRLPVAVTIGRGQRTIRFQVDYYSGANCELNLPFVVTLTRR
jgi:hypothetical protein